VLQAQNSLVDMSVKKHVEFRVRFSASSNGIFQWVCEMQTATPATKGANRQSRDSEEQIYFISHPADATEIFQTSRTSLASTSILFNVSLRASKAHLFQTRFLKLSS